MDEVSLSRETLYQYIRQGRELLWPILAGTDRFFLWGFVRTGPVWRFRIRP